MVASEPRGVESRAASRSSSGALRQGGVGSIRAWPGALAFVLSVSALHSLWLACVAEDAFISFRFARNLVRGYGLVWYPGEGPVEGYTNFSWVLLSAGGIRLGLGEGVVTGNSVTFNGANGIDAFNGSTLIGNTVRSNTLMGMSLDTGTDASGYANNVIRDNGMGTVTGGVEMGANVCNGNTTCP